ncbi:MAG: hypothetical protein ACRBB6_12685 [Neptuniibacter sp.]
MDNKKTFAAQDAEGKETKQESEQITSTSSSAVLKKMESFFASINKSVYEDLDNGQDGCTGRIINDSKHHIDDVINNKSIRIAGRNSIRP